MTDFETEKKLIGEGKVAKVYLYDGFAYKVFKRSFPTEFIEYEFAIQEEIVKTPLPVVRYYQTENPRILKMDYINGITLADKIRREKYTKGVEDLFALQKSVHHVLAEIPFIMPWLKEAIESLPFGHEEKSLALQYLSELPDGDCLCHLDFHFLNVMSSAEGYHIVDWISARRGNPIFDFARTYVIMYEFAYRLSGKYLKILKESGVDSEEFRKAVYIVAMHRSSEHDSEKVRKLIENPPLI